MDKTAQRRSILNKLHEMANVPARSAENFFKPELKRVFAILTDADDVVRANLSGERVGKAVPSDPTSAKALLKEAKSFINRKEYMSAVASLGRFHKKMQDVTAVLDGLKFNVESLHHRFLFEKLPSKHRQHLEELEKRLASERLTYFTKEAGILDFFHNIGTQRGRALAAWEKRYPEVVNKIRDGAINQLEASVALLNTVLASLKEMASFRASRKMDNYLEAGKSISTAFKKYDSGKDGFRTYYNEVIKPYLDAQRKIETEQATKNVPAPEAAELGKQEVGEELTEVAPVGGPTTINQPPTTLNQPPIPEAFQNPNVPPVPTGGATVLPPPPNMPTGVEPADSKIVTPLVPSLPASSTKLRSEEVAEQLWGKKSSYRAFVHSLEAFADEDPTILAIHIAKYARSIQAEEPDTAIKLFGIAKTLRG